MHPHAPSGKFADRIHQRGEPSSDGGEDCQEIEIVNPIPIVLMVMERSVPARGVVVEPERKFFG